jgi:hypothetical protein
MEDITMRGDKEKDCLRLMQKKMGSLEGTTTFFGCSIEEKQILQNAILAAIENPNQNDFPDMIFDCGFIEHFQITSAKETRKGSFHISNESTHDRCFDKQVQNKIKDLDNLEDEVEIKNIHEVVGHTHECLLESMKKNCDKHIISLNNYNGPKDIGIFMIQYTDAALEVLNCYDDNLRHPSGFIGFYPHLDKELLKIVQNLSDGVDFVIFVFQATSYIAFPYDAHFEVFSKKNLSRVIADTEIREYRISPLNVSVTHEYRVIKSES